VSDKTICEAGLHKCPIIESSTTKGNQMKKFSCIASIDNYLQSCNPHREGDAIGTLGDNTIYIIGLFIGKRASYFGVTHAIRWNTSPDDKARGFWNRGLGCYTAKFPEWALQLKRCK
jgi:hypothetical protein